jgi:hypothetical protein
MSDCPVCGAHQPLEQQALAGEVIPQPADGDYLTRQRRTEDILARIERSADALYAAQYAAMAAMFLTKASR